MTTRQLPKQQITGICRSIELAFSALSMPEEGFDFDDHENECAGIRYVAEGLYHLRQVHGPAKVRELVAKLVRQSQEVSI